MLLVLMSQQLLLLHLLHACGMHHLVVVLGLQTLMLPCLDIGVLRARPLLPACLLCIRLLTLVVLLLLCVHMRWLLPSICDESCGLRFGCSQRLLAGRPPWRRAPR